jgi:prephenate dehydratase
VNEANHYPIYTDVFAGLEIAYMKKIAYLGPENSYSFLAAKRIADDDDILIDMHSFTDVLESVRNGNADIAVTPMENSVEGNVNEVADCLIFGSDEKPLFINAEFVLVIENHLIMRNDARPENIKTIVTHWQPYAQCRQTLKKLLPDAKIIFAESTSAAVKSINDDATAAIGGKQLVTKGYKMHSDVINDNEDNCTRFAILSSKDIPDRKNNKLTLVFEAENKPGGLLRLLEIINVFGMNMTRLESRPHKSVLGRYVFIADINGHILDNSTSSALELIKRNTPHFKYLGCYEENSIIHCGTSDRYGG